MTPSARSAATAALLLVAGCHFVLPKQPTPGPEQGAWPRERDRFTRTQKIYDRLDDKAFATATYQAPSVRAARIERIAVWRALTDAERDARLAAESAEAGEYEDFLLSFYTNDFKANDLDSPRSVWRVALEVRGEAEVAPVRIEQLRVDSALEQLYPYIGHFDIVYRVRFARWKGPTPLAELPFVLHVAGAIGHVALSWTPAEPPAAAR